MPRKIVKNVEDAWNEIAERAIREAEEIDCSLPAFARGLRTIEEQVRERRSQAEDEADRL